VQETSVVERFFPPSPTPGPTRTPIPTLEQLVIATSVAPDGHPNDDVVSVSCCATIYAAAHVHYVTKGAKAEAVFGTLDGAEMHRETIKIEQDSADRWLAFAWQGGAPPGQYVVAITIDGALLNSLVFRVY
jgi:hypothetical protein